MANLGPWGATTWGSIPWGWTSAIEEDFAGGSTSSGEFEQGYGSFSSTSSGEFVQVVVDIMQGGSVSSGEFTQVVIDIMAGGSTSSGTFDTELLAALAATAAHVLNLDTKRSYLLSYSDRLGFARFNNVLLGISATKISALDDTETADESNPLSAYLSFKTDFGTPHYKAFRRLYCEEDSLKATITLNDGTVFTLDPLSPNEYASLPRTCRDKVMTVKVENKAGEVIEIMRLHGEITPEDMKGVN